MGQRADILMLYPQYYLRPIPSTQQSWFLPTMDAHRHYAPAALAAAVAAWRAGNDVHQALTQAGYAAEVAGGLAQYVASPFFSPDTPPLASVSQSQGPEEMSKRARTDITTSVAPGVKKYVRSCMDRLVEEKVYTQGASAYTPGLAGGIRTVGVSAIVNGNTSVTRVGDVIHLDRLIVNWYAYDSNPGQVRVLLFIDRQANGSSPAVSDVLAYSTVTSPPNPFNTVGYGGSRFKILSDEV